MMGLRWDRDLVSPISVGAHFFLFLFANEPGAYSPERNPFLARAPSPGRYRIPPIGRRRPGLSQTPVAPFGLTPTTEPEAAFYLLSRPAMV